MIGVQHVLQVRRYFYRKSKLGEAVKNKMNGVNGTKKLPPTELQAVKSTLLQQKPTKSTEPKAPELVLPASTHDTQIESTHETQLSSLDTNEPIEPVKQNGRTDKSIIGAMPSPESLALGMRRIEWFSDSHLLSKRIEKLLRPGIGHLDYVRNLVARHTGSANAVVFGTVVAGLAKKGRVEALEFVDEMKRRNLSPTPQTYTALFGLYAVLIQEARNDFLVKKHLKSCLALWNELLASGEASEYHLNSILSICSATRNLTGFQTACNIFSEVMETAKPYMFEMKMGPTNQQTLEKPPLLPTVATFTIMMRLHSQHGSKSIMSLEKSFVDFDLEADNQLINAILSHLLKNADSAKGKSIFRAYASAALDLPMLDPGSSKRATKATEKSQDFLGKLHQFSEHADVSGQNLDIIIRFLLKSRQPEIAIAVVEELTRRPTWSDHIAMETGSVRSIVKAACAAEKLEDAYSFVLSLPILEVDEDVSGGFTLNQELLTTVAAKGADSLHTKDRSAATARVLRLLEEANLSDSKRKTFPSNLESTFRAASNISYVLSRENQSISNKLAGAKATAYWVPLFTKTFEKMSESRKKNRLSLRVFDQVATSFSKSLESGLAVGRNNSENSAGNKLGQVHAEEVAEWNRHLKSCQKVSDVLKKKAQEKPNINDFVKEVQ
ncbi:hypothetical protein BJ741DRAFT_709956 [Chytriomyces cf. hyalinus JEL632]|nr:hypothetical protein BJ741DRAFT_709956 [Chytriomyces cf. hyalinus JEL632]